MNVFASVRTLHGPERSRGRVDYFDERRKNENPVYVAPEIISYFE